MIFKQQLIWLAGYSKEIIGPIFLIAKRGCDF